MISSKSYGLQNETRQYLRRLYSYGRELNLSDVADIDNFIKGLKQLNLWQNIIVYPFRKQHNIGSGANVLSFGGIGKLDGTAINGPAWGESGINFTAANSQYIRIPNCLNSPVVAGFSMICMHQPDYTAAARALLANDLGAVAKGMRINVQAHSYIGGGTGPWFLVSFNIKDTSAGTYFNTLNTANMHVNYATFSRNTIDASLNNAASTYTSTSVLPSFDNTTSPTMGIGARNGQTGQSDFFQGTMSLMMIANKRIPPSEYLNVYALIKTTIGKGLGLP